MYELMNTGIESHIRNATPEPSLGLVIVGWVTWTTIIIIVTFLIVKFILNKQFQKSECRNCSVAKIAAVYADSHAKWCEFKTSLVVTWCELFDHVAFDDEITMIRLMKNEIIRLRKDKEIVYECKCKLFTRSNPAVDDIFYELIPTKECKQHRHLL